MNLRAFVDNYARDQNAAQRAVMQLVARVNTQDELQVLLNQMCNDPYATGQDKNLLLVADKKIKKLYTQLNAKFSPIKPHLAKLLLHAESGNVTAILNTLETIHETFKTFTDGPYTIDDLANDLCLLFTCLNSWEQRQLADYFHIICGMGSPLSEVVKQVLTPEELARVSSYYGQLLFSLKQDINYTPTEKFSTVQANGFLNFVSSRRSSCELSNDVIKQKTYAATTLHTQNLFKNLSVYTTFLERERLGIINDIVTNLVREGVDKERIDELKSLIDELSTFVLGQAKQLGQDNLTSSDYAIYIRYITATLRTHLYNSIRNPESLAVNNWKNFLHNFIEDLKSAVLARINTSYQASLLIADRVRNKLTLQYYIDLLPEGCHKLALREIISSSPQLSTMSIVDFDDFISDLCFDFIQHSYRYPDLASARTHCFNKLDPGFSMAEERKNFRGSKCQYTPAKLESKALKDSNGHLQNESYAILKKNSWILITPAQEAGSYITDWHRSISINGMRGIKQGETITEDEVCQQITSQFPGSDAQRIIKCLDKYYSQDFLSFGSRNGLTDTQGSDCRWISFHPGTSRINIYKGQDGSIYFDVTVANIPLYNTEKNPQLTDYQRFNIVPGTISTRFKVTDAGPKLLFVETSNSLLSQGIEGADILNKKKIKKAHDEEIKHLKQVIAATREPELRRLAEIILSRFEVLLKQASDSPLDKKELDLHASIPSLVRKVLIDPYNRPILDLLYDFIDEAERKNIVVGMELKGALPGEKTDQALETALRDFHAVAVQIADRNVPNSYISKTFEEYIANPSVQKILAINIGRNNFASSNHFLDNLHCVFSEEQNAIILNSNNNDSIYRQPSLELMFKLAKDNFSVLTGDDDYQRVYIDLIMCIAKTELLDINGNIRANILEILEKNGLNTKSFSDEQMKKLKAKLINNFIEAFVLPRIKSNFAEEIAKYEGKFAESGALKDKQGILEYKLKHEITLLNAQADINSADMNEMYDSLIDLKENNIFQSMQPCVDNLLKTERDRLAKTVRNVSHDSLLRFSGRYVVDGIDAVFDTASIPLKEKLPVLNKAAASSTDYIQRPTPANKQKCIKVAKEIEKLPWGRIAIGLGIGLLGGVVIGLSIAAAVVTFGAASPLSLFGATLGASMIGFGVSVGVGAVSMGVLTGSATVAAKALSSKSINKSIDYMATEARVKMGR